MPTEMYTLNGIQNIICMSLQYFLYNILIKVNDFNDFIYIYTPGIFKGTPKFKEKYTYMWGF